MAKKKKELKQQTLEDTMGRSRVRRTVVSKSKPKKEKESAPDLSSPIAHRSSPRNHNAPPSSAPTAFSFMQGRSSPLKKLSPPRNIVVLDSSSEEEEEEEEEPEPIKRKQKQKQKKSKEKEKGKSKAKKVVSDDEEEEEEDEDDDDVVLPSSSAANRRRRSPVKRRLSSESESEEVKQEEDDEEEDELPSLPPPKKILGKRSRIKREDSSDDDVVLTSPRKKVSRNLTVKVKDEPGDSDEDDKPLVTPVSAKRLKRNVVLDDSDEEDEPLPPSSPTKRRRLIRRGGGLGSIKEDGDEDAVKEEEREQTPPRPSQAARRKPRTEKEKARELLRRKRAGENINEEDLEDEDDDEEEDLPKKALYDSDSDNVALREFEDDDEGVLDVTQLAKQKKRKKKERKKQISSDSDSDNGSDGGGRGSGDNGEEGSEDDWLVDDGEIGVPDDLMAEIPLAFTKHSHKPLKEHFRDVIEWCVQVKVNPGFAEKQHEIYRLGWQKLDDEVRALAQSKFASSAWKTDFYMALRARPYFTNEEVGGQENVFGLENCAACGRSGHPAKWQMSFSGSAYYKSFKSESFLEPVETRASFLSSSASSPSSSSPSSSSSSSSSSEDDEDSDSTKEKVDVDEDGNVIPPVSKSWLIGSVCNSNAETAHSLLHWKFALLDWVDSNLKADGHMAPDKLEARLNWKPKKKYKLVDKILKQWVEEGTVRRLWREFKETIESARNKSTTGRFQGR